MIVEAVGWPHVQYPTTTLVWPLSFVACTCGKDARTTHVCEQSWWFPPSMPPARLPLMRLP
jgi:hypothetical protein